MAIFNSYVKLPEGMRSYPQMVSKISMEVLDSNKQWLKTPEDVKKFLQKDGMLGNIGF